jgi:hypothetical protein
MSQEIVNKIADSGLVNLSLDSFYPTLPIVELDLKQALFMELILKEKDFRDWIKNYNWQQHTQSITAICCSADAIMPMWAYMLVASKLQENNCVYSFGDKQTVLIQTIVNTIQKANWETFKGKKVLVNGCGKYNLPEIAFTEVIKQLQPIAQSIMFGEACSSVPVFKAKK